MKNLFSRSMFLGNRAGLIPVAFLLSAIFFVRFGFGEPISINTARIVAKNLMSHLDAPREISSVEPVQNNGQTVGYLIQLMPRGYVLVAADNFYVPVKGYSLNSTFSDLPPVYVENLLKELTVSAPINKSILSIKGDTGNSTQWDFLLNPEKRMKVQAYTPDTFLLSTRWNQTYPYNKLNPKIGNELTLTGCVQTAVAQVMRYHAHPSNGSGVFEHTWNGKILTAVMNRPFNWDAMPGAVDGSVPEYQQDEVAALMRDLGILNQAKFEDSATGASFNFLPFERAFGYASISTMSNSDSNFFTTLIREIDAERPVLLSMPGHMVVADGYSSDGTGRNIHVNLGWGGTYDDFYYLDETINIPDGLSFVSDHTIYYNIRPCEGDECDPYNPTGGAQPPVIASNLDDMIIDAETTVRIEAHDPDGDTVTLSASSACDELQVSLTNNLLTLMPSSTNRFCRVSVLAQSQDGSDSKTFDVLCLEEKIYIGSEYDIGGQFASQNEEDAYSAYLGGDVSISGTRGYSNQAFYIRVENQGGATVFGPDDDALSGTLDAGFYTITASLASGGYYYPYEDALNDNTTAYIISVTSGDVTYTVADYAESLGISPIISEPDSDHDGVTDAEDLCAGYDDSIDVDNDGTPDGCDVLIDSDGDGVSDSEDLCSGYDDSVDVDADGIPDGCDDSVKTSNQGFDYLAYLAANPDLPSDWGKAECMNHYKLYGFWENRAVTFNLDEYLNANPDLPTNWTLADALNHYNMYGKFENRLLAFDDQEYMSLYADLPQNWTYEEAFAHYANYGSNEGRIASFDEVAYLELYEDFPSSWGQAEAFYHYIYYGQYEDRVYDPYDESVFDSY